jgi:UDP-glucose 4-epimerase
MKKILVTGCNGYIGSHTVKALKEAGYIVHGIDRTYSMNKVQKYLDMYMHGDANDFTKAYRYDSVVHLAGYISVEESVKQPFMYFNNNTLVTHWQLHFNSTNGCDNFIFASTAAAFDPVSPYAQSKLMAESLVKAMASSFTIFRFFNVAGNNGEFGQIGNATHLVRIAAQTAAGKRSHITINGTDWDTIDGTCVRDYVHVSDLVDGIVKAVDKPSNKPYECIGTGNNYSVRQVINTMKKVSGIDFKVVEGPKRDGDAPSITVPNGLISDYIKCEKTLEDMCLSAYKIELR